MTMEDNLKGLSYPAPPRSGSVVVGTETQWCPLQLNKLGSDQFRVSCSQFVASQAIMLRIVFQESSRPGGWFLVATPPLVLGPFLGLHGYIF